jgi:hypothetical protein
MAFQTVQKKPVNLWTLIFMINADQAKTSIHRDEGDTGDEAQGRNPNFYG